MLTEMNSMARPKMFMDCCARLGGDVDAALGRGIVSER